MAKATITVCPECYKAEQEKRRAELDAKYWDKAFLNGEDSQLVALNGSGKQVAWANNIRRKAIVEWLKVRCPIYIGQDEMTERRWAAGSKKQEDKTMKKLTQIQFDALTRDADGYIRIPASTDCTEVNFGGADRVAFGERCRLEECKFAPGCTVGSSPCALRPDCRRSSLPQPMASHTEASKTGRVMLDPHRHIW